MGKTGFVPITIEQFAEKFAKSNPGESAEAMVRRLKDVLQDYKSGITCSCGEPLWVIGSAATEYGCFRCITMESAPDDDYEIVEACEDRSLGVAAEPLLRPGRSKEDQGVIPSDAMTVVRAGVRMAENERQV